jgi:preprotein translocase SecE subunit
LADRKPRIRKSAPTVRERVEATRAKAEAEPSKVSKTLSGAKKLTGKVKLPSNKVTRNAAKPFRVIGKILAFIAPKYFINSWREVRQVAWPNRRETWRLTLAVFIFAAAFGSIVAGVDKGLDEVFKKLVLK